MTLAVLVPVLLIGLGTAAVVGFFLVVCWKWWRMLDAERELSLAPVRLLKEQDRVICDVIAEADVIVMLGNPIRDKLIAAHDKYQEKETRWNGRSPPATAGGWCWRRPSCAATPAGGG